MSGNLTSGRIDGSELWGSVHQWRNCAVRRIAESCLFAFDPESKAVHYMCVTSMGEVHDHKGTWTDAKTIEFEPLQAGMMGKQVIETLKWHFDDDRTIYKTSEVKLADGSIMQFQFKGKRVS